MADSLYKVSIPRPLPGLLPPIRPGIPPGILPDIPPGFPTVGDDPTERIREALRNARSAPEKPPPPYRPNPMSNIEDDLAHHPGFFDKAQRTKYDPFHVEVILDGAGDILARAMGDRAAYDQFRDRYYERTLELTYLISQLELDELEFGFGVWDRPLEQAKDDLTSALARKVSAENRKNVRNNAMDVKKSKNFDSKYQATLIAKSVRAAMTGAFKSPSADIASVSEDGTPGLTGIQAHQLVYNCNMESAHAALEREILNYNLEMQGEEERINSLKDQVTLAQSFVEIESKLKALRMNRFSALQAYHAERTKALTDPDGPHNALVQMKAIQDRFGRDMVDLYDRLGAVARGLDLIYGLELPPASPKECSEKGMSYLDLSVAWVRNVVRYLNARATHDRTITLSYSLRQLVGDKEFDDALVKARKDHEKIKMTFTLPNRKDPELSLPRLRGVSCYSLYADAATYHGVFSLQLYPPPYAYMSLEKAPVSIIESPTWPNLGLPKERGNSVGGNDARPWDDFPIFTRSGTELVRVQEERTPAFVARIAPRYPIRAPEVFASDSLFNISPFDAPDPKKSLESKWKIAIDATTTIGREVGSILVDLELDFYLLARPEPEQK